jgi:hypothetical protein
MYSFINLATLLQETGGGSGAGGAVALIITILLILVCLAIYIASIVWVYRDANRRGKSGTLVALLVALISWPIGLVVWLIIRDKV